MIDQTLRVGVQRGLEGGGGRKRERINPIQSDRGVKRRCATCFLLDFVDSRIQYMALFISITVCIVILALILLFCYVR